MKLLAFCLACIVIGSYLAVTVVWPTITAAVRCSGPLCQ